MRRWNIVVAFVGGNTYHRTKAEICVSPLFFYFSSYLLLNEIASVSQSYLFNTTSNISNHVRQGEERERMFTSTSQPTKKANSVARNCFAIILSRIVALLSIMLLIILKKKTELKLALVRRVRGRGYTFHVQPYWRRYTYH